MEITKQKQLCVERANEDTIDNNFAMGMDLSSVSVAHISVLH